MPYSSQLSRLTTQSRSQPKSYSARFKDRRGKLTRWAKRQESAISNRLSRIERTIEVKEGLRLFTGTPNLGVPHNQLVSLTSSLLATNVGAADNMDAIGQRVGDQLTLKGVSIKLFVQNQAQRPKVYYRVMVIRSAKGDTPDRSTLFKGLAGNKMIDQINNERFTVLAQQVCTVTSEGSQAWTSQTGVLGGVPLSQNGSDVIGAVGSKIISMWVPGDKFSRGGKIIYENSGSQPKFYSYHLMILCYDWYYTPQDVNNVGAVTEGWCKLYYQDA